jgi:hypothetical protein
MVVSDEAVFAELEAMKKQYVNDAILNNMLKNWNITQQELLVLIKKDLAIQTLIDRKIAPSLVVSDAACQTYYQNNLRRFEVPEKIRVSHLCFFVNEDAPDAQKQKAETAIQSLRID